jgi:hypothetical protein
VRDNDAMVAQGRRELCHCFFYVMTLNLGARLLSASQERIATERRDDQNVMPPSVAIISALIVCKRFSACSKTSDAGDSNTSSVISSAVIPYFT